MSDFSGKTAIVTGAGNGIGYELCRQLALRGVNLILNDLDVKLVKSSCRKINEEYCKEGSRCVGVAGDAGDLEVIGEMVERAMSEFGRLDIAVANAGRTTLDDFLKYTQEQFDQLIHLNLQGSFFLCQKAALTMIDNHLPGRILVMSSVTGHQAHEGLTAYGMTKAALRSFAKLAGVELAPYNITVNAISPGATMTERTLEIPNYVEEWERITPTRKVTTVTDIANAALFLLNEKSSQITGQTIIVDGGWTSTSPQPGSV